MSVSGKVWVRDAALGGIPDNGVTLSEKMLPARAGGGAVCDTERAGVRT